MIDYDEIYNMPAWQIVKWITGAIVLAGIVAGIYFNL